MEMLAWFQSLFNEPDDGSFPKPVDVRKTCKPIKINTRVSYGLDNAYEFQLVKCKGGAWYAYIVSCPYLVCSVSGQKHAVPDDSGRIYVCWDKRLYRKEEVEQLARAWAEIMQTAIAKGCSFDAAKNLVRWS